MGTERSDRLHQKYQESTEKFDYFMLGVLGALCAYVSQSYKPERLGFNPGTFELLALLILVLAAVFGFRRIEAMNLIILANHKILHANEKLGMLEEAIHRGGGLNVQTGEFYTVAIASAKQPALRTLINQLTPQMDKYKSSALFFYKCRNWLTLLGFSVLVCAKLASAYN